LSHEAGQARRAFIDAGLSASARRSRWPALVAVHYRAGRHAPAVQYWTGDQSEV